MDKCGRIRDLIDDAVSTNDRRMPEEAKSHINGCEECRKYLSAVLRDDERFSAMAASMEDSIRRVESGVKDTLAGEMQPESGRLKMFRNRNRVHARTGWASVLKLAAVAAAVLLVLWAFSGRLGPGDGSSEVLARALRNAVKAENVTYREIIQIEGADTVSVEVAINKTGVMRRVLENGDISLFDYSGGRSLLIPRHGDTAHLTRSIGIGSQRTQFNYLKMVSDLHATSGKYIGSERIDERETYRYSVDMGKHSAYTIWVDPATDLPVRIEHISGRNVDSTVVFPRIVLSNADFGGDGKFMKSISIITSTLGFQKMMKTTATAMAWNVALDESLFSFEPPKGYKIVEHERDESFKGELDLVEALSLWTQLGGGHFPARIGDLADSSVVNDLLITAYDGDGDPYLELDEALKAGNILLKGLTFAMERQIEGVWTYEGMGVRLGDANRPICWYKGADAQNYRVVYGDLSIVDARADELPRRPQPVEHD